MWVYVCRTQRARDGTSRTGTLGIGGGIEGPGAVRGGGWHGKRALRALRTGSERRLKKENPENDERPTRDHARERQGAKQKSTAVEASNP